MTSPIVLLTGATDGIGKETALELARRGAKLLLTGRSRDKLARAAADVERAAPGAVVAEIVADLSSLDEVRRLAVEAERIAPAIDVLLNNAGVFEQTRRESRDGFELTFAVNHLAPFVLTHALAGPLFAAPAGRVVNVSSMAHARGRIAFDDLQLTQGYDGYRAYAQSKLANILFTVELARRFAAMGGRVTANALHPGVVSTNLLRGGFGMDGPDSLAEGAATSVHLALAPEVRDYTGGYFVRSRPSTPSPAARDPKDALRLYERSCELTGTTELPG
jgi:NAD(P)-dependent dehydrogenase (short-subunit alcohol dehydrogenase family)